jgi:AraC family transcriptional regulator, ethanolamine operon transcriptional activator
MCSKQIEEHEPLKSPPPTAARGTARNPTEYRYSTAIHRVSNPWTYGTSATSRPHTIEPLHPGAFEAWGQEAWLGPIQLGHERINCGFSYRGRSWQGSRVFCSFVEYDAQAYYDCRPLQYELVSHRWDAIERVVSPIPMRSTAIVIDEAFLLDQLGDVLDRAGGTRSLSAMTVTVDPQRTAMLQRCVADILGELTQRPELIDEPSARRDFSSYVIATLAHLVTPSTGDTPRLPPPTTRAYIVRKATEIMEARLADPLSLTDLCREIGVCARTLRYSFEEVTRMSPTQYLLCMRLNGVRRELSSADNRLSVQAVATRWGFWHMSRFARYYRQAFGEKPSATLSAAQAYRVRGRNPKTTR